MGQLQLPLQSLASHPLLLKPVVLHRQSCLSSDPRDNLQLPLPQAPRPVGPLHQHHPQYVTAEQAKEIFAEAKSRGYDTKVLRKIIAQRKMDPQEVSEAEAVFELYKEALGM